MKTTNQKPKPNRINKPSRGQDRAPFLDHVYEFRYRLMWVASIIVVFTSLGYIIRDRLVAILIHPADKQQFIYTTPGGGFNFLLQISIYFGIVVAIPVIIYHTLRYLEPLLANPDRAFVLKCASLSAFLAICGMAFGYFVGLPAALVFLTNQFENKQITALFTLNDYLSFVTVYMLGSALMFQLPVVMIFANRIKPLNAKKLALSQRWVIKLAFVAAAIITPTPDIFNQCIIAIPIILVYQFGVILVAYQNRYSKTLRTNKLRQQDIENTEKRQNIAKSSEPLVLND